MTTMVCETCGGKGTIEVDDPKAPCTAEIVIGHETIRCFGSLKHPGEPHMAILCDPCIMCGQFDECHETCGIYAMEPSPKDTSDWWFWNNGDLTVTRAAPRDGQEWRNRYQPTSPHARREA